MVRRYFLFVGAAALLSCHREKVEPKAPTAEPTSTAASAPANPTSAPALASLPPASEPMARETPKEPTPAPTPEPPATAPVADPAPTATVAAPTKPKPLDAYDTLLKTYVSGGKVDYSGISKERAVLDEFLDYVAKAPSAQKLAFWINAYNATVISALLDNKLPKQVMDISGFFDAKKYTIAGQKMTLNDLEGKIRKEYKDPRVHFALNCGARSCPPLYPKAFRESSVDKTLSDLTSKFLNGSGVKVDATKKELQVTKLFEWYGQDFIDKEGSVEAYLKKWVTDSTKKAALDSGSYKITFQNYDWSINKK